MTLAADALSPAVLRPAAPRPLAARPGLLAALKALRSNPIEAFAGAAYDADVLDIGRRRPMLLVNDPVAIERILVQNAANYRKSEKQQRRLRPGLGEGLLTAEGEAWRSARRIAAPLFSPKALGALLGDMGVAADAMAERWRDAARADAVVDLASEFQRLAYEVVSRTVFSGALDEDRARVHMHMAVYFDTIGRVDLASVLDLPRWWPSLALWKARPSLRSFRQIVGRAVDDRMAAAARDGDLLDRLIGATDPATGRPMAAAEVSDNVLTFLAAGHETTGNALAWIFYLLALHPDAEERLRAEVAPLAGDPAPSREALERLVFARAVINEALRLYPPAPFMAREALGDDEIAGQRIGKGAEILISPWIVHRRKALWDAPDLFRPERFMGPEAEAIPRGAFLPFGLGPRICIGQGFATLEILTVLARVLPAFRFRLENPREVFPQARITLQPQNGVRVRLEAI